MNQILAYADTTASQMQAQSSSIYERTYWPYIVALPVMYLIGAYVQIKKALFALAGLAINTNFCLVDGVSINSRRMKEGAARWPSLNTCYNFVAGEGPTAIHRKLDTWWMCIRNAQAVRNRLKIAREQLAIAVHACAHPGQPVRILSLAAGTAQGVIEVVAECNKQGIATEILLLDQDESALRYARDLARSFGVSIDARAANVLHFNRYLGDFKPDVVEMMGLIDYLKDGLVIALIKKIRLHLPTGGYFFTCHIHANHEAYFLKQVVDWDMLYRSRDKLEDLLIAGGFLSPKLYTEPLNIHTVAGAQKI